MRSRLDNLANKLSQLRKEKAAREQAIVRQELEAELEEERARQRQREDEACAENPFR